MSLYYSDNYVQIFHGCALDVLRTMDDCSVDSVVTDPPYGLSFMGKKWDYDVPSVDIWQECLRVLKPGGHLLSFAGTRTQHRMAAAIEDAGFEIRDMIAWVYGSGFPKSLDVSKAIDKCNGEPNRLHKFTAWMRTTGLTARQLDEITGTNMGGHYLTAASQPAIPTAALWAVIRPHCDDVPAWVDELVARIEAEREVVAKETRYNEPNGIVNAGRGAEARTLIERNITAPATEPAKQWQGWGTALKPALEPITVARKPLIGTVAANVLEHGTGGLNIDGCRVGTDEVLSAGSRRIGDGVKYGKCEPTTEYEQSPAGRWPANFTHDGSDEVVGLFPNVKAGVAVRSNQTVSHFGNAGGPQADMGYADSGSAARFFYCAKSSRSDRNEGLDSTCTVKYIVDSSINKGELSCKDVSTVLVELLRRAMSESTARWHIGECGASITGLCQSDSLSTTLTAISKITESKIFSLLTHSLISESIAGASCETANGGSPAESAENSSRCLPTTTPERLEELARGVKAVVSPMLSAISDAGNWKPATNSHSTVKPFNLMRWLCRLVTPPQGIVLDPFMGSGSTGKGARCEGFRFIGIEREEEYCEIAKARTSKKRIEQEVLAL